MQHKGIGMGLVLISERELQRIEVLAQVLDGSFRSATAAGLLGLSQRQIQRLLGKIGDEGAPAVRRELRSRPSNNRVSAFERDDILSLIRSDHPDFDPALAAEKLAERHGESLRQWMTTTGLWHSQTQRHRVQPGLHAAGFH